jgi:hypothetical protein
MDDVARSVVHARPRTVALLLVVLVLPIYLLTRVTPEQLNVDAEPAALPAWHLVQEGTIDLTGVDTDNPFVVDGEDGRRLSNRYPGLWLVAVPAYVLTGDARFSPEPATVTAVLLATAAIAVAYLLLRRLVPPPWALGAALVLAFGTPTWPISAEQLWPHAPAQLLLLGALLLLARQRPGGAGVLLGLSALVRPILGVVPAVFAVRALLGRRYREAAALALPAGVAGAGLLLYGRWAFGELSLSAGQGDVFRDYTAHQSPVEYVANVASMLFAGTHGLLVWSPVVAFALLGLRRAWPEVPDWARTAAVAAVAYEAVHLRLSPADGGLPLDFRYPLEPITLALPALVLGARAALGHTELRRRLLVLTVAASVLLQGMMAVSYECDRPVEPGADAQCSIV